MGIKLDPIEAINQLKEKYPQYDFSKAVFTKSSEKITVICPKHGEFYPTYNNMKSKNRGCPKCNGGVKFTEQDAIDKLKQFFPDYDYSKFKYTGHDKECTLICKNGHEVTKKYNVFAIGYGCNECKDTNLKTEEHKIRTEDYKSIKEFVRVLELRYDNIDWSNAYNVKRKKDKCTVRCKCHGDIEIILGNLREGIRGDDNPCLFCNNSRTQDPISLLKEMNQDLDFSKFKYVTSKTKSTVICPKHGEFEYSFFNAVTNVPKYRVICPKCNPTSMKENTIREYIEESFGVTTIKDRSIIKSKFDPKRHLEIDIYIPELKIGFEFNGTYWHSERHLINKRKDFIKLYGSVEGYHNYKYEEAKKAGVDLYFIAEEEYDSGIQLVYDKIDDIMSKLKTHLTAGNS